MAEQPAAKQYVQKAKSIPVSLYLMVIINIVFVIGFIFKELTVLYMLGSLIFVIMLVATIGKATEMWENPKDLISENIVTRIQETHDKIQRALKSIDARQNDASGMSTLITILFFVYVTSMINDTIEIFLIFNFVYAWIFLPRETQGIIGVAKQHTSNFYQKITPKQ